MEERIQRAIDNHHKGYNCAQAVVCAYSDLFGIDEKVAFRMSEGFGAGMGNFKDTCGAVSGMFMVASLIESSGGVENGLTKAGTYKTIRELSEKFREKNQSTYCKDLRGEDGTPKLRSCDGCIEDASKIVEEFILEKKAEK